MFRALPHATRFTLPNDSTLPLIFLFLNNGFHRIRNCKKSEHRALTHYASLPIYRYSTPALHPMHWDNYNNLIQTFIDNRR